MFSHPPSAVSHCVGHHQSLQTEGRGGGRLEGRGQIGGEGADWRGGGRLEGRGQIGGEGADWRGGGRLEGRGQIGGEGADWRGVVG